MAVKTPKTIKTEKDARAALNRMREIKHQIEEILEAEGVNDLQAEADALKTAATDWAVTEDQDVIDLGQGVYARLRRDKYGGRWITDGDDLLADDVPVTVVPLKAILKKKYKDEPNDFKRVWYAITRRVADPTRLEKAVAEGTLTESEISGAFFEKDKKPFLQVYGGK